jgi:adenylylsulfate reductase subunit B
MEKTGKRIAIKEIDTYRCIRCGVCMQSCPNDVIRLKRGKPAIVYPQDCSQCFACVIDCPREAISLGWVRT